jgi:2'-5' RNA ligase
MPLRADILVTRSGRPEPVEGRFKEIYRGLMSFAVELYFDEAAEKTLREAWKAMADAGISTALLDGIQRPHVTLGVSDEISQTFKNALALFAKEIAQFELSLSSVGAFNTAEGVIFLAPTPTRALLDLHKRFHAFFDEHAGKKWPLYLSGTWVPHCTLAFRLTPEQLRRGFDIAAEIKLPLTCRIIEIGLLSGVGEPEKELVSFPVG